MRRTIVPSLVVMLSFQSMAGNVERGSQLYRQLNCIQCHGAKGEGLQEFQTPRIGGQRAWYIEKALGDFGKKGVRGRTHTKKSMKMSVGDRADLAAYISNLK